jgi:hypothetical protein
MKMQEYAYQVMRVNCISIDVRMIYTHTLTRARDSVNVNSHVTHSPKRYKPRK